MKSKSFNLHNKLVVLKHAEKTQNVKETCDLFEISRTTYYKWLKAYEREGEAGLIAKPTKKPQMPNQISKALETEILQYVLKHPKDGPRQIYYELKSQGLEIGETGVFNVLKRHGLTQRTKRLAYAFRHKVTKERIKPLSQGLLGDQSLPGYTLIQGVKYLGHFDGIGKVYQFLIYDVASRWATVKLYASKRDIDVWQPFESKFMYLVKTFKLDITHILIVKEKAFLPFFLKGDHLKKASHSLKCQMHFIDPEDPMVGYYEAFCTRLNEEFYDKFMRLGGVQSLETLEKELNQHIRKHNFFTTHKEGPNKGLTPGEIVLKKAVANNVNIDTLPIWMNALIEMAKKENKREK